MCDRRNTWDNSLRSLFGPTNCKYEVYFGRRLFSICVYDVVAVCSEMERNLGELGFEVCVLTLILLLELRNDEKTAQIIRVGAVGCTCRSYH